MRRRFPISQMLTLATAALLGSALACGAWAAGGGNAAADGAASDQEFAAVERLYNQLAASQELVDRLYEFMEKNPKDTRGDRVQFWVALTQQKRKFHNEAIKEFNFLISDFPTSPLRIRAFRAQADSYIAIAKEEQALECFRQIVQLRPKDFAADSGATACFQDAVLRLADNAIRKNDPDAAASLLMQLPDINDAVSRVVQVYINANRHEQALAAIRRLKETQRDLAYRLAVQVYASRPGTTQILAILQEIFEHEKPSPATDELVRFTVAAIAGKGDAEKHKVLEIVDKQYERLRRWARFALCEMDKTSDVQRLITFAADFNSGSDVEQVKTWIGEFYERAAQPAKAREAYQRLADAVAGHFLVAGTYYGPLAVKKDYPAGRNELTNIVKRFYSPGTSAEALTRRAELESGPMRDLDAAIATLRELVDRFPKEGRFPQNALMRLGLLLRQQKKQDDAIAAYEKLIVQYPEGPHLRPAWLEIAYCHEEQSQNERAIDVFKTILRRFPRTHEASVAHTILEDKYKIPDINVSDR